MYPPLIIEPHREYWKHEFERESAHLFNALGESVKALHHIGSTAIPGIHAKPVIDILAEVEALDALDLRRGEMERLGYEAMGEFGIPGRRYFRKNNSAGVRTHHVHAFLAESPGIVRHLAFRDYLRCHHETAQEYSALKIRLVASCCGDMEDYMNGKDCFVKDVERRALAWVASFR